MGDFVEIYRAVTITLTVVALLIWCIWLVRHPQKWGYAAGVILWLVNIMAFQISVIVTRNSGSVFDAEFFNGWSNVIRWQALIYAIGAAVLWWNDRKHHVTDE